MTAIPPSPPSLLDSLIAFVTKLLTPPELPPRPPCPTPARRLPAILPLIADDELPWFRDIPLAADRRPVYRSQYAAHLGDLANEQAAMMRPFSLDEEENLRHRVARYRRAGLLDLIAEDLGRLDEIRRLGLPPSTARRHFSQPPAEDLDQLQRSYGSPAEDRLRLLRFHQRRDALDAARASWLPARALDDLRF